MYQVSDVTTSVAFYSQVNEDHYSLIVLIAIPSGCSLSSSWFIVDTGEIVMHFLIFKF